MFKVIARGSVCLAVFVLILPATLSLPSVAQNTQGNTGNPTFFTPGNLVVAVEGCGVRNGNCAGVAFGNGTGAGNSTLGGYGDNQAAPLTLFQYSSSGSSNLSFVNSLALPQSASGANVPVSGEYGSSSEGTVQLSSGGQYLTIMGYGVGASTFNANPSSFGPSDAGALAQSVSLTGQSGITPVPRVVTLIDANGNVNSSTPIYNIFNTNNPRSAFTVSGSAAWVSGQGASNDATQGVFYVPIGGVVTAPTAITGLDALSSGGTAISQDTRTVQVFNNTLYVSTDTKGGTGSARSFVGTLGSPPNVTLYNNAAGPTQLSGIGTTKTGKLTITSGPSSNGNNLNAGAAINLSPVNYFFASPSVLYIADSGDPKNDSNGDDCSGQAPNIGDGGLQKWVNSSTNGTGTWSLKYTLYQGLNIVSNCNTTGTSGLYGVVGVPSGTGTIALYVTNYTLNDYDYTYIYGITDTLSNTVPPGTSEAFTLLDTAPPDSNFKGISLAPSIPNGSVEVTTVPSGLTFTSSGTGCAAGTYVSPITLAWTPGSTCTLNVATPQSGGTGVQYAFSDWEDGSTGTSHVVIAPSGTATYTATFSTQYLLTTSSGTGGTVSAGGYYTAGTTANITATPLSGYYFVNFSGTSTSTNNPFPLVMNSAQTIMANFAAITQSATSVLSNLNPSVYGQGVSFTANVTGSSPTGAVQFSIDGSAFGSPVTLASGMAASGSISSLAAGTHTVTATYSGDTHNAGSTGTLSGGQVVNSATAAVTLMSSLNPSVYGQPVAFTATINGAFGLLKPNGNAKSQDVMGSVTWNDSIGALICSESGTSTTTVTSGNPGTATCTVSNLAVNASDTITGSYSGDSNHSASAGTLNQTINAASSTVGIASSLNPSVYGQSVQFTATISGQYGLVKGHKKQVATGSVAWTDANGSMTCSEGNPSTVTSGVATCRVSNLAVNASDTITGSYSGDSNHSASAGTLNQTINAASSTVGIASSLNPSVYGQSVQFTATISGQYGLLKAKKPVAGGTVTWSDSNGALTCTESGTSMTTVTSGSATCTTASLAVNGSDTITGNYSGDANHSAGSGTVGQTINAASSTVGITSSLNPSTFGQSVTFTATITGQYGLLKGKYGKKPDVGGTVAWTDSNGALTCSESGNNTTTVSSGTAMCTTSGLAANSSDTITGNYSGDADHGAASGTVSQTINQASQTISFTTNAPASAVYNSNFTVAASASSGLAVAYTSSGSCSNVGATYTMTSGTGSCSVIANQAGNSNYSAAPQVTQTTNATKASQTISFTTNAPASAVYNSNFTVAAGASSGLAVAYTSGGSCSNVGATYTMTSGTGSCSVIANQAGNSNYSAAPQVTQTTNATKASQTISFTTNAPASAVYNSNFTVAAGASSGLAVAYTSGGSCSNVGATYTMTSGTGSCSVIANQAGNSNYSAAPQVTQTTSATLAAQAITVTFVPTTATKSSMFTVMATGGGSGNALVYTNSTGDNCTNVGATYTMGTKSTACSVIINQAGNSNYSAAPQVTKTVTVAAAIACGSQCSITGAPASAPYLSTFTVGTTSGSDTSVPTVTAAGACTISGSTVSMTKGTGTCTITAIWAANYVYEKATVTAKVTATKGATVTSITGNTPNPCNSVPCTVTVNSTVMQSPANATYATGNVVVTASTGEHCSAAVSTGLSSCNLVFHTTGSRTITATYDGSGNNSASTSAPVSQGVN